MNKNYIHKLQNLHALFFFTNMKNISFMLLTSFFNINIYAQTSDLVLNTLKPEAGQKITITYTGKLAKVGTKMSYILCYDENFRMPIKVIPTQLVNNQLVGSFTLPDSIGFFTIKIANKKEIDNNNGNGYGFNVYKDGKPKRGTFFAEGYSIFMNKFFFNGNIDSEKALKLLEKEYALNPDMKKTSQQYYIEILSRVPSRKIEAINLAKNNYEEILNTGINENYSYRYSNIIADGVYKVSDSLKTLVVQKYPTGFVAINKKLEMLNRISMTQPDTAISLYKNIKKNFPKISIGQNRFMTVELLAAYAKKFDFINLNNTFDSLVKIDKSEQIFIMAADKFNDIAWSLSKSNKDLRQARVIIEKSIIAHKLYDSLSTFYGDALGTYAAILSKLGDKKGAILNQRKTVYLKNGVFPNVNQQLIQYLVDDYQFKEAKTISEGFINDNASNPKIDSLYKVAYMAINGSEKDFENVSTQIKEKADAENTLFLKDKLINVAAPDFELKDLNGNIVKLSDFRGSIVVLDFWATWCGPCIGSFPAMKKVMNELKDKSVKFLFIDTMESEEFENKNEKVKKILSSKKVSDFHVLLDEIKDLNYQVTTAYNVQSIPAKFIIDKVGKIRYQSTGYSSDENLIKELKAVVKLISE